MENSRIFCVCVIQVSYYNVYPSIQYSTLHSDEIDVDTHTYLEIHIHITTCIHI